MRGTSAVISQKFCLWEVKGFISHSALCNHLIKLCSVTKISLPDDLKITDRLRGPHNDFSATYLAIVMRCAINAEDKRSVGTVLYCT